MHVAKQAGGSTRLRYALHLQCHAYVAPLRLPGQPTPPHPPSPRPSPILSIPCYSQTHKQAYQQAAPRATAAEEARTLMAAARHAVLSTLSGAGPAPGAPYGSVVEFGVDAQGRPLLATSSLSPHTADLAADGRCSLTVMAAGFQVGDGRPCVGVSR